MRLKVVRRHVTYLHKFTNLSMEFCNRVIVYFFLYHRLNIDLHVLLATKLVYKHLNR